MSPSLQQALTKHTYFATETGLYYVEEIVDEEYLIENCMTYDMVWVKIEELESVGYREVVCETTAEF